MAYPKRYYQEFESRHLHHNYRTDEFAAKLLSAPGVTVVFDAYVASSMVVVPVRPPSAMWNDVVLPVPPVKRRGWKRNVDFGRGGVRDRHVRGRPQPKRDRILELNAVRGSPEERARSNFRNASRGVRP
jgi:hypothetical protein